MEKRRTLGAAFAAKVEAKFALERLWFQTQALLRLLQILE
jgi:hypothetical protein